jgi:hypothetical protein
MQKLLIAFFCFGFFMISSHEVLAQEEKTENQLIEEFIDKKKDFNKEFGYGFRIQLYNGFEVEAKKTRAKFRIEFPDIKTYLVYRQPEWKIQVGTYKTKLEADRALLEIKREFSGAIVVPLGK